MPKDDPESEAERLARTLRAVQDTVGNAAPAAGAGYTLIGAILGLGGIGYAIDRWLGTFPWVLVSGLFLGMAAGFYELIKVTWPRR